VIEFRFDEFNHYKLFVDLLDSYKIEIHTSNIFIAYPDIFHACTLL